MWAILTKLHTDRPTDQLTRPASRPSSLRTHELIRQNNCLLLDGPPKSSSAKLVLAHSFNIIHTATSSTRFLPFLFNAALGIVIIQHIFLSISRPLFTLPSPVLQYFAHTRCLSTATHYHHRPTPFLALSPFVYNVLIIESLIPRECRLILIFYYIANRFSVCLTTTDHDEGMNE